MGNNLLIMHGGAPTAVLNASLYGAIEEGKAHREIGRIYGAAFGTGGLLKEQLRDLTDIPQSKMDLLLQSPASAIGSSRDNLKPADYEAMLPIFKKYNIKYILMNGGNGTMDTAGKIAEAARGLGVTVMGIPKTVDNDIAVTDHSPGFASAARYIAGSVAEVYADVAALPIHISVVEAMGRNAGWIAAASALAGDSYKAPDLIYFPELDFNEEAFLEDVHTLIKTKKHGVVVASEGLHGPGGKPLVDPIFQIGRDTYFGDISSHLSNLIIKKLGYKARCEKPGVLGRSSAIWQSKVDQSEAILAGKYALKALIQGENGKMTGFRRLSSHPYKIEPFLVDIKEVMMHERKLPREYINNDGNGVTGEFIDWCRPLLGDPLPELIDLR